MEHVKSGEKVFLREKRGDEIFSGEKFGGLVEVFRNFIDYSRVLSTNLMKFHSKLTKFEVAIETHEIFVGENSGKSRETPAVSSTNNLRTSTQTPPTKNRLKFCHKKTFFRAKTFSKETPKIFAGKNL
jgi:hypothetical protein